MSRVSLPTPLALVASHPTCLIPHLFFLSRAPCGGSVSFSTSAPCGGRMRCFPVPRTPCGGSVSFLSRAPRGGSMYFQVRLLAVAGCLVFPHLEPLAAARCCSYHEPLAAARCFSYCRPLVMAGRALLLYLELLAEVRCASYREALAVAESGVSTARGGSVWPSPSGQGCVKVFASLLWQLGVWSFRAPNLSWQFRSLRASKRGVLERFRSAVPCWDPSG